MVEGYIVTLAGERMSIDRPGLVALPNHPHTRTSPTPTGNLVSTVLGKGEPGRS